MNTTYWLAACIILQVGDAYSTIYGMRLGATEANTMLAKLIGVIGRDRVIVGSKIIYIGVLVYFRAELQLWMLQAITAFYAVNLARNIYQIKKQVGYNK